jgi:Domain of unknown function (DUF4340)
MKRNQLFLLLALAVVLGIAGVYLQISRSAGWNEAKTNRRIFQNLPINDIAKIQIRSSGATVTLEKKSNQWGVAERSGYPADFDKIRELTRTLWELKPVREIEIGPSQFGRLKIETPGQGSDSGVEVELKGEKDAAIGSLILGKMMEQGEDATRGVASRFIFNPSAKDRVYLVSETFATIEPVNIGSWLDKAFISPGELQEVQQNSGSNNPGWRIVRDTPKGDWKLQDLQNGENLDKPFTQAVANFSPSFTDVRPASVSADETGLAEPFRVQLKMFDGFKYDLAIGKSGADKTRYLKFNVSAELNPTRTAAPGESPDDKKKKDEEFDKKLADLRQRLENERKLEQWVFLVPDWNLDQLLKRRDEILAKPSPAPAPSPTLAPSPTPASVVPLSPSPASALSPAPTPGTSPGTGGGSR